METPLKRFNARYKVDPNTGCWDWDHSVKGHGYGSFDLGKKTIGAHAASWILHNGAIPTGLCVLHKCDNRRCVNPDHLYLGTKKDNRRDFMERHPKAKELCERAAKTGAVGVKRFWDGMSAEERKAFCLKRAQRQWDKNGGVHPVWGTPIRRPE